MESVTHGHMCSIGSRDRAQAFLSLWQLWTTTMQNICKRMRYRSHLTLSAELTYCQDYDFDYSDDGDDANQSGSADVENQYYTAKCASSLSPTCP